MSWLEAPDGFEELQSVDERWLSMVSRELLDLGMTVLIPTSKIGENDSYDTTMRIEIHYSAD